MLLLSGLFGYLNLNVYFKSLIVSSLLSPHAGDRIDSPRELLQFEGLELGVEVPILMTLLEMR